MWSENSFSFLEKKTLVLVDIMIHNELNSDFFLSNAFVTLVSRYFDKKINIGYTELIFTYFRHLQNLVKYDEQNFVNAPKSKSLKSI